MDRGSVSLSFPIVLELVRRSALHLPQHLPGIDTLCVSLNRFAVVSAFPSIPFFPVSVNSLFFLPLPAWLVNDRSTLEPPGFNPEELRCANSQRATSIQPEPISAREDLASGLAMGLFSGYSREEGPKPHLVQRTGFLFIQGDHSTRQKLHCLRTTF